MLAAVVAYFIKGLCGFANTLVFTAILSFGSVNANISPIDLLLGYPANVILTWKNRKNLDPKVYIPLAVLVLAGSIPGAFLLKNVDARAIKLVFGVVERLVNPFIVFANFLANVFVDPVGAVIHLFGDMADSVLAILEKIASAIDLVFGSNLAAAVSDWRGTLSAKVEGAAEKYGNGKYQKVMDNLDLSVEKTGMERFDYGAAWDKGYSQGEAWGD